MTNSDDPVAPNTQHINEQDAAAKTKPSELFDVLTQVPTNNTVSMIYLMTWVFYQGIMMKRNWYKIV